MTVPEWSDNALDAEIRRVQSAIQTWAERRDVWFDCCFKSYLEHVDGEPQDPPVVTLLICEGGLYSLLSGEDAEGQEPEFHDLLKDLGYFYENRDGVTMAIYAEDAARSSAFAAYFHWQWVCSLIKEDTGDVYQELFDHFSRRPDDLNRLHWQDFETLLFESFRIKDLRPSLGRDAGTTASILGCGSAIRLETSSRSFRPNGMLSVTRLT